MISTLATAPRSRIPCGVLSSQSRIWMLPIGDQRISSKSCTRRSSLLAKMHSNLPGSTSRAVAAVAAPRKVQRQPATARTSDTGHPLLNPVISLGSATGTTLRSKASFTSRRIVHPGMVTTTKCAVRRSVGTPAASRPRSAFPTLSPPHYPLLPLPLPQPQPQLRLPPPALAPPLPFQHQHAHGLQGLLTQPTRPIHPRLARQLSATTPGLSSRCTPLS